MADNEKIVLGVAVDASAVKPALDNVARDAGTMAQKVAAAGKDAGTGIEQIGVSAGKSAQQTKRELKSITDSIQRAQIDIATAGKSASEALQIKAGIKGIDVSSLKPQIDALRALEIAQNGVSGSMQKTGMSAAAMSNAMRNVPAQMTDIVVSLQGGQKPLTVLLQQGGQLKDLFGGIGPAAKALGGYVVGLVNPFTIAAAVAGTLGYALHEGASELMAFQNAARMTGGVIGLSTSQFAAMGESLNGIATRGKASEVLTAIAASGKLAGGEIKGIAEAAILMEKATGQAVEKTVAEFAKLADEPVKASLELNKTFNYLTASVYEQIKALEEQGKKFEAAELAEKSYSDTLKGRAASVVENVGLMERAWRGITGVAKGAWDAMLNVGREASLAQKLAAVSAEIEKGRGAFNPSAFGDGNAEARAKLQTNIALQASLQEQVRLEKRGTESATEANRVREATLQATVSFGKLEDQFASNRQKRAKEIAAAERDGLAAGKSRIEIEKVIAGIQDKYKDKAAAKPTAARTTGESEVAGIRARVIETQRYIDTMKAQGLEAAKQTEGEKLVVKIQQELEGSLKGVARANKEKTLAAAQSWAALQKESSAIEALLKAQQDFEKSRDKEISGQESSILKMEEKAQAMEDQVRMYGMSKEAIESLNIARLQERADILAGFAGSEGQIALIQKEIDARQRLATATDARDGLDAGVEAAKKADAEWKKTAHSIETTMTDALMRAFEGGKSFARALRDTIVNMFKTMVLRPIVQAVMSPVSAAIGGALGLPGAANAAGEGGPNLLGMASNASSLYSATSSMVTLGSQVVAGTMSVANALGTVAANATGTGISGLLAANGAYGTAAAGSASAMSGGAMAAMAAIPVWGWVAMAGVAVAAIFGGRGEKEITGSGLTGTLSAGGPASVSQYSDWKQDGGWFHSDRSGRNLSGIGGELQKMLDQTTAGITQSTKAFAGSIGLAAGAVDGYKQAIEISLKDLSPEKQQEAVTQALGGFADGMASLYTELAGFAKEGEGASATLARLSGSLTLVNGWMTVLSQKLLDVSAAGADAASQLADQFGGADKLSAAAQTYFDLYYSEAEKAAESTRQVSQALAGVGVAMPETKAAFRELAAGLDLGTEAGRKAYAVMLAVAPVFATAADSLEQLGRKSIEVFEGIAASFESLLGSIGNERGAVRDAMLSMADPTVMSKDQIQRGIAGINVSLPNNAGVVAAQAQLSYVDGVVAGNKAQIAAMQTQTPSTAALDAAAAVLSGANQRRGDANAQVDMYRTIDGGKFNYWLDQAFAGNDLRGTVPDPSGERNAQNVAFEQMAASAAQQPAQAAYNQQQTAYNQLKAQQDAALAPLLAWANELASLQLPNALNNVRDAQSAYVDSLRNYAIDASKATEKLGKLRDETVKYYDTQKQLAGLMTASAAGLRGAAASLRQSQLTPQELLAKQTGDFAKNYSMTLATSGATQAGYADKLTALLPELANSIKASAKTQTDEIAAQLALQVNGLEDRSATSAAYAAALSGLQAAANSQVAAIEKQSNAALSQYIAQSDAAAAALAANAPQDYAADSLAMLGQIDATLAALEAGSKSAERIIADAIKAGSDQTTAGLRAVVAALTGQAIPAFASGGYHAGGLRLVGENGPEIEATGSSRIWNASDTRAMLSGGGNDEMIQELRALRQEVAGLRAEAQATAGHTSKTARLLDRAMPDGDALATRATA
ncbi:MAG: phage tail length tape measure family protein [Polaromonas sp.]